MKLEIIKRASVVYAWIMIIVSIAGIGMGYAIFDDIIRVKIYNIALETGADMTIYNNFLLIWNYIPYLFSISLIIYGIVYTIRKGADYVEVR